MNIELDDVQLSQLCDGELDNREMVRTLLGVLDDEAARGRLREQLKLRELMAPWREQAPSMPGAATAPAPSPRPSTRGEGEITRHLRSLITIAATLAGGLLVGVGAWLGSHFAHGPTPIAQNHIKPLQHAVVSPVQREQVAKVFAFHESVAGPLQWYAADDQEIELSAADAAERNKQPVAAVLRLTSVGAKPWSREYVVVCRDHVPVTIPLPHSDSRLPPARLYLSSQTSGSSIDLRYSLTFDPIAGAAGLAGHRQVGLEMMPLGELALGDQLIRVECSAWRLEESVQ
ncbi:MAG TPA: hypothetical protein VHB77_19060 [Planctomycetaceae bacterium]|nr:hypothetical protein [Planctomycetaceae bacterium]